VGVVEFEDEVLGFIIRGGFLYKVTLLLKLESCVRNFVFAVIFEKLKQ
jgi:hypothetical protein